MKAESIIICIVALILTFVLFNIPGLILGAIVALCVITLAEHNPEHHEEYDEWECEYCHKINPSTVKKCLVCKAPMFDIRDGEIVHIKNESQ